jgi:hypothetical protein
MTSFAVNMLLRFLFRLKSWLEANLWKIIKSLPYLPLFILMVIWFIFVTILAVPRMISYTVLEAMGLPDQAKNCRHIEECRCFVALRDEIANRDTALEDCRRQLADAAAFQQDAERSRHSASTLNPSYEVDVLDLQFQIRTLKEKNAKLTAESIPDKASKRIRQLEDEIIILETKHLDAKDEHRFETRELNREISRLKKSIAKPTQEMNPVDVGIVEALRNQVAAFQTQASVAETKAANLQKLHENFKPDIMSAKEEQLRLIEEYEKVKKRAQAAEKLEADLLKLARHGLGLLQVTKADDEINLRDYIVHATERIATLSEEVMRLQGGPTGFSMGPFLDDLRKRNNELEEEIKLLRVGKGSGEIQATFAAFQEALQTSRAEIAALVRIRNSNIVPTTNPKVDWPRDDTLGGGQRSGPPNDSILERQQAGDARDTYLLHVNLQRLIGKIMLYIYEKTHVPGGPGDGARIPPWAPIPQSYIPDLGSPQLLAKFLTRRELKRSHLRVAELATFIRDVGWVGAAPDFKPASVAGSTTFNLLKEADECISLARRKLGLGDIKVPLEEIRRGAAPESPITSNSFELELTRRCARYYKLHGSIDSLTAHILSRPAEIVLPASWVTKPADLQNFVNPPPVLALARSGIYALFTRLAYLRSYIRNREWLGSDDNFCPDPAGDTSANMLYDALRLATHTLSMLKDEMELPLAENPKATLEELETTEGPPEEGQQGIVSSLQREMETLRRELLLMANERVAVREENAQLRKEDTIIRHHIDQVTKEAKQDVAEARKRVAEAERQVQECFNRHGNLSLFEANIALGVLEDERKAANQRIADLENQLHDCEYRVPESEANTAFENWRKEVIAEAEIYVREKNSFIGKLKRELEETRQRLKKYSKTPVLPKALQRGANLEKQNNALIENLTQQVEINDVNMGLLQTENRIRMQEHEKYVRLHEKDTENLKKCHEEKAAATGPEAVANRETMQLRIQIYQGLISTIIALNEIQRGQHPQDRFPRWSVEFLGIPQPKSSEFILHITILQLSELTARLRLQVSFIQSQRWDGSAPGLRNFDIDWDEDEQFRSLLGTLRQADVWIKRSYRELGIDFPGWDALYGSGSSGAPGNDEGDDDVSFGEDYLPSDGPRGNGPQGNSPPRGNGPPEDNDAPSNNPEGDVPRGNGRRDDGPRENSAQTDDRPPTKDRSKRSPDSKRAPQSSRYKTPSVRNEDDASSEETIDNESHPSTPPAEDDTLDTSPEPSPPLNPPPAEEDETSDTSPEPSPPLSPPPRTKPEKPRSWFSNLFFDKKSEPNQDPKPRSMTTSSGNAREGPRGTSKPKQYGKTKNDSGYKKSPNSFSVPESSSESSSESSNDNYKKGGCQSSTVNSRRFERKETPKSSGQKKSKSYPPGTARPWQREDPLDGHGQRSFIIGGNRRFAPGAPSPFRREDPADSNVPWGPSNGFTMGSEAYHEGTIPDPEPNPSAYKPNSPARPRPRPLFPESIGIRGNSGPSPTSPYFNVGKRPKKRRSSINGWNSPSSPGFIIGYKDSKPVTHKLRPEETHTRRKMRISQLQTGLEKVKERGGRAVYLWTDVDGALGWNGKRKEGAKGGKVEEQNDFMMGRIRILEDQWRDKIGELPEELYWPEGVEKSVHWDLPKEEDGDPKPSVPKSPSPPPPSAPISIQTSDGGATYTPPVAARPVQPPAPSYTFVPQDKLLPMARRLVQRPISEGGLTQEEHYRQCKARVRQLELLLMPYFGPKPWGLKLTNFEELEKEHLEDLERASWTHSLMVWLENLWKGPEAEMGELPPWPAVTDPAVDGATPTYPDLPPEEREPSDEEVFAQYKARIQQLEFLLRSAGSIAEWQLTNFEDLEDNYPIARRRFTKMREIIQFRERFWESTVNPNLGLLPLWPVPGSQEDDARSNSNSEPPPPFATTTQASDGTAPYVAPIAAWEIQPPREEGGLSNEELYMHRRARIEQLEPILISLNLLKGNPPTNFVSLDTMYSELGARVERMRMIIKSLEILWTDRKNPIWMVLPSWPEVKNPSFEARPTTSEAPKNEGGPTNEEASKAEMGLSDDGLYLLRKARVTQLERMLKPLGLIPEDTPFKDIDTWGMGGKLEFLATKINELDTRWKDPRNPRKDKLPKWPEVIHSKRSGETKKPKRSRRTQGLQIPQPPEQAKMPSDTRKPFQSYVETDEEEL